MTTSFRIVGNAIPTDQHPVNLFAAANVCYFAEKIQTAESNAMMSWYGQAMNANLDDIIRTVKSRRFQEKDVHGVVKSSQDINGYEIDMQTWKREIRDLINITKQVEKYLKSLRY